MIQRLWEKTLDVLRSPETRLAALIGSISFISSMVFSLVSSLGPAFQRELHIAPQEIGTIMGSYMLSSAASGFVGTLYLDRFDRRKALAVALSGVVFGLVITSLAPNYQLLIAARILSGLFAGPSNALALATLIDNVPLDRRGRALGTVSGLQALAQIVGIPIGLQVTEFFGTWRAPFIGIAVLAAITAINVVTNLPPQRAHLANANFAIGERLRLLGRLLTRPLCLLAYGLQMTGVVPLVAITTIMAVYLLNNLGFPSSQLSTLYFVGGLFNMIMGRLIVGPSIDSFGAGIVSVGSTVLMTVAISMAYLGMNPGLPWIVVFALFFVTSSSRLIVSQTTNTRIPRPNERAGFQSLSSAIQAGTMGLSALSTRYVLGSTPEGKLTGIAPFALGVIVVGWIYPFLVYRLNALLARRDLEEAAMEAVPAE